MEVYEKLNEFIESGEHNILQCTWEDMQEWISPQLCIWISYWSLEYFIEEFYEYFDTESSIMGNLQQDCCWINLSDLFDQENDELEKYFPK